MSAVGFETLDAALDAHTCWCYRDIHPVPLTSAGYRKAEAWEAYLSHVVPEVLTAGGASLEAISASWNKFGDDCPMRIAFGPAINSKVPQRYYQAVSILIALFDLGFIPNPLKSSVGAIA